MRKTKYEKVTNPNRKNLDKKHYMYFISDQRNRIKVGVTGNLKKRLETLQIGNADKLTVLTAIEYDNGHEAYLAEGRVKISMQKYKLRGEWYHSQILKKLVSNL